MLFYCWGSFRTGYRTLGAFSFLPTPRPRRPIARWRLPSRAYYYSLSCSFRSFYPYPAGPISRPPWADNPLYGPPVAQAQRAPSIKLDGPAGSFPTSILMAPQGLFPIYLDDPSGIFHIYLDGPAGSFLIYLDGPAGFFPHLFR